VIRPLRFIPLVPVALALLPAAAAARPWHVETVRTAGPAVSRAVDLLPNGRTAVLVQRRVGRAKHLELLSGGRTRLLDSSSRGFLNADVQHDARGRLVVIWVRYLEGPTPHVFAWTAAGGRQKISGTTTALATLAVSAGGRAAIAYWSLEGTFVARGTTGEGFKNAENVDPAAGYPVPPGIAVTGKGRIVVAWIAGQSQLVLRRADPGASFGPLQVAQLRPREAGNTILRDNPRVVTTGDGRAVVVVQTVEGRAQTILDSRVEALEWRVAAAHPSAAATLSRGAAAGAPAIVAQGATAVIGWTQRPKGAPRSLWTARWTAKALQKPNIYDTHALASPLLLTAARNGAVDAFYRAGGPRWFTVRLSAAGRYNGTTVVTPPGEPVALIHVAEAGPHLAALWSSGPQRTRLARPTG
jgi:hypothetical protein